MVHITTRLATKDVRVVLRLKEDHLTRKAGWVLRIRAKGKIHTIILPDFQTAVPRLDLALTVTDRAHTLEPRLADNLARAGTAAARAASGGKVARFTFARSGFDLSRFCRHGWLLACLYRLLSLEPAVFGNLSLVALSLFRFGNKPVHLRQGQLRSGWRRGILEDLRLATGPGPVAPFSWNNNRIARAWGRSGNLTCGLLTGCAGFEVSGELVLDVRIFIKSKSLARALSRGRTLRHQI
jgi:hypothetical protein